MTPPDNKDDKGFTNSQVGALIEDLKNDFRTVLEVVEPLREDMAEVKERLTAVETEVKTLKDVVKIALPRLENRVTQLETKVGA